MRDHKESSLLIEETVGATTQNWLS
jgi:hypothetical protein